MPGAAFRHLSRAVSGAGRGAEGRDSRRNLRVDAFPRRLLSCGIRSRRGRLRAASGRVTGRVTGRAAQRRQGAGDVAGGVAGTRPRCVRRPRSNW